MYSKTTHSHYRVHWGSFPPTAVTPLTVRNGLPLPLIFHLSPGSPISVAPFSSFFCLALTPLSGQLPHVYPCALTVQPHRLPLRVLSLACVGSDTRGQAASPRDAFLTLPGSGSSRQAPLGSAPSPPCSGSNLSPQFLCRGTSSSLTLVLNI